MLAISVDKPSDSARIVSKLGLPFPILSDGDREVIIAYKIVHAGGGPDGGDIAIPAHFLISSEGNVVYRYVAKRIQDRPNPGSDLAALIELTAK